MTTTKRRITVAERRLAATIAVLEGLVVDYPTWRSVLADSHPPLLRAAGHPDARGSDVPDPTGNLATGALGVIGDIDDAIDGLLAQARWVHDQIRPLVRAEGPQAHVAAAERRATLCVADPLCPDNAVRDGKCWRHYRAALATRPGVVPTEESATMRAASTVAVLEVPLSASGAAGTCGRCGHEVRGGDADHVAELLGEHHAHGCPVLA